MLAISMVDYMHELKSAGFTDQQSEVQARRFERLILEVKQDREALKQEIKKEWRFEDLTTKQDLTVVKKELELSIEKVRYETLKFIVWTGVGVSITLISVLGGMIAKGFHWF